MKQDPIRAVVQGVNRDKNYAITFLETPTANIKKEDSVTFSLDDWGGNRPPRKRQVVMLHDISEFENGWRAEKATPVQAS